MTTLKLRLWLHVSAVLNAHQLIATRADRVFDGRRQENVRDQRDNNRRVRHDYG